MLHKAAGVCFPSVGAADVFVKRHAPSQANSFTLTRGSWAASARGVALGLVILGVPAERCPANSFPYGDQIRLLLGGIRRCRRGRGIGGQDGLRADADAR
jgi:hypothetical protein